MSDIRPACPVLILAKYGVRRCLNRVCGQMLAVFRRKREAGRTATTRKGRKGIALALLVLLSIVWASLGMSTRLVNKVSDALRPTDPDGVEATPTGPAFLPSEANWPTAAQTPAMVRACGVVLCTAMAAVFLLSVAASATGTGQAEWNVQWLFTFPVRARTLFSARVLERALLNLYSHLLLVPLLFAMLWTAGLGWHTLPLALGMGICVSLLIASAQVLLETWLRLAVNPRRLKDIQAFFAVAGWVALGALFIMSQASALPEWFTGFASSLPEAILWFPAFLPVRACLGGTAAWAAIACMAGLTAVSVCGSVYAAEWLVRKGLISEPGPRRGHRGALKTAQRQVSLGGMAGKETRMLLRDRNRLVGVLIAPLALIGLNLWFYSGGVEFVRHNFAHASVLAFVLGAFVMSMGACRVLADEQKTLWLLCTFPKALHKLFLDKVRLWIGVGLVYCAAVLVAAAVMNPQTDLSNIADALVALAGVAIFAFVAVGLGFLGTDPLDPNPQRTQRLSYVYLYQALAALYVPALYTPWPVFRIAQVACSALLAVAIWQKIRDSAPYLLDPVESPPPRVRSSDGLFAAFAFLSILNVVLSLSARDPFFELPPFGQLLVAGLLAGVLVAVGSLYVFWRRGVISGLLRSLAGGRQTAPA